MLDWIVQSMIVVFGGSAIWFVTRKESWQRWGYILGMCSQPAWFYTTITNEQYGIAMLSLWYTYAWGQGIYFYWIKPLIINQKRQRG